MQLRRKLENVLITGGVEMMFAGHDHNYERTFPQGGVTYVVTGGGAKPRRVGSSDFTVVIESQLHFVRADVSAGPMVVAAINVEGIVIDEFSVKPRASFASCG